MFIDKAEFEKYLRNNINFKSDKHQITINSYFDYLSWVFVKTEGGLLNVLEADITEKSREELKGKIEFRKQGNELAETSKDNAISALNHLLNFLYPTETGLLSKPISNEEIKRNHDMQEHLGKMGEDIVFKMESEKLTADDYAEAFKNTFGYDLRLVEPLRFSQKYENAGYDIFSFSIYKDCDKLYLKPCLLEVKTTTASYDNKQFFISINQLNASKCFINEYSRNNHGNVFGPYNDERFFKIINEMLKNGKYDYVVCRVFLSEEDKKYSEARHNVSDIAITFFDKKISLPNEIVEHISVKSYYCENDPLECDVYINLIPTEFKAELIE